jgi:hypothetical protein
MNNWTSFHLEHFRAHCKNSVSLTIEIRLALKGPWYRVSLSVPFHLRSQRSQRLQRLQHSPEIAEIAAIAEIAELL